MESKIDFAANETAAEFLRAQEVRRPGDIEELQQATTSANDEIERVLFQRDRWQNMKEEGQEESSRPEGLYEEWIDVSLDLEQAFIDENDGALGRRVIELLALDAGAFAECAEEARFILQQTTPMALRVYPFMHRLVDLGVASNRTAAVERLSSGDLVKQEKVHNVSVTPRRRTIIGLLRDLDARLPLAGQTDIWSLEVVPELPATAVISDPFQSGNEDLSTYWRQRILAAHETYGRAETILSLSGDRTMAVTYELENIADRAGDDVLRHAAKSIATWLEGKQIYYTDPDPRDFELYHLGMEDPQQLMEIMRSLDVIKHLDPELFFELIGVDPSQGGRSLYFGSFLHKALFNTQRTLNHASPELGEMALRTMMSQLLTLDERVQTYSAVVSQESLKAMAGEMKKSVDAANTKESKAQTLMMMAVPFSRMAIDAEVRRQLDALRESSSENVVEELRRRIDDIEHPLKLAEYIGNLPGAAEYDIRIMKELRAIFGDVPFAIPHLGCQHRIPERLKLLYDRIPLIDETRDDLGFALRVRVAIRDAISIANIPEEYSTEGHSEKTRARQFLKGIMPNNLYREDFEAVRDHFGSWDRQMARRFSYASRSFEGNYSGIVKPTEIHLDPKWSEVDRAFFIGQALVGWEGGAHDRRYDFSAKLLEMAKEHRPDLIFLSIIAHPQGKEVAFKYFDKFCEIVPPERMVQILSAHVASATKEFLVQFEQRNDKITKAYLQYLAASIDVRPGDYFGSVPYTSLPWRWKTGQDPEETLDALRKMNLAILEKRTPWTKMVAIEAWNSHGNLGFVGGQIDPWEIWGLLGKKTLNPIEIEALDAKAWDEIDVERRYSSTHLTTKLVAYFHLSTDPPASTEIEKIQQYVAQKRDALRRRSD